MMSIAQAADYLGVSKPTLRRWDRKGILVPKRTSGNHRRYTPQQLDRLGEEDSEPAMSGDFQKDTGIPYLYARVSSYHQQKSGNLKRQVHHLQEYADRRFGKHCPRKVIKEHGSGLNTKRRGLIRLIKAVKAGKVSCVVVMYRDRLTRFGYEFLKILFYDYKVSLIAIADEDDKTLYERLIEDFMALLACFSGRMYKTRTLQYTEGQRLEKRHEKLIRKHLKKKKGRAWRSVCGKIYKEEQQKNSWADQYDCMRDPQNKGAIPSDPSQLPSMTSEGDLKGADIQSKNTPQIKKTPQTKRKKDPKKPRTQKKAGGRKKSGRWRIIASQKLNARTSRESDGT